MVKFRDMVHGWWHNPVDWQRRTFLVLFSLFVVWPVYLLMVAITIALACIYIPFMTIMSGWDGYQDAVDKITNVIMDPFMEIIYLEKGIWDTHWARPPEK